MIVWPGPYAVFHWGQFHSLIDMEAQGLLFVSARILKTVWRFSRVGRLPSSSTSTSRRFARLLRESHFRFASNLLNLLLQLFTFDCHISPPLKSLTCNLAGLEFRIKYVKILSFYLFCSLKTAIYRIAFKYDVVAINYCRYVKNLNFQVLFWIFMYCLFKLLLMASLCTK